MLVPMDVLLKDAREQRYAVAAPGVHDMQTTEAAFQAAHKLRAPIILDVSQYNDLEALADMAKFYARRYPEVSAAINLDHGSSFEVTVKAVRAGFTSVMIDCSTMPFDENVRITSEVVKMAHSVDVSVEAELGHVGRGSQYDVDRDAALTDPDEAVEYVKRTSVDCLAVAVGTAHGMYSGTPKLDFERLSRLREVVPVPLVLHGGSSTGDENLSNAVRAGICKVNLWSDLMIAGTNGIEEFLSSGKVEGLGFKPLSAVYGAGVESYKSMIMHYIRVFDGAGRV